MKLFYTTGSKAHFDSLAFQICQFARSDKSIDRQGFVRTCFYLAQALPKQTFTETFFMLLLTLHVDPVDNVRLCVARLMSQAIHPGYFASMPEAGLVSAALSKMRIDPDPDVAYFSSLQPGALADPNGDQVFIGEFGSMSHVPTNAS